MSGLPHPLTGQVFDSPVPPGTGWPGDPAEATTPIAVDPAGVATLARHTASVAGISAASSVCRACPRLVEWRERVAHEKRASFAGQPYWGRPTVGWGSETPGVLVIGLAPAANGGNRTGRIFTGDRSGDWLFAGLHRVGLAVRSTSEHAGDGQRLVDTRMIASVRCAPPENKPTTQERDTCASWLDAELAFVLPSVRAIVCLGLFGWDSVWRALGRLEYEVPRPRVRFAHGAEARASAPAALRPLAVLGCYHPSQQNTFTGKLTEPMLDAVLSHAARLARG